MILGWNIATMPSIPLAPRGIEYSDIDIQASTENPFNEGTEQFTDWGAARMEWSLTFPPISQTNWPAWSAFLALLRGRLTAFQFGDAHAPLQGLGIGAAVPVVNGSNQTGFSLSTRGWTPSQTGVLKTGDWFEAGYRLYRATAQVNTDGSGNATIPCYPNLRDGGPPDGASLVTYQPKGLWILKNPARKAATSVENSLYYSLSLDIREALNPH